MTAVTCTEGKSRTLFRLKAFRNIITIKYLFQNNQIIKKKETEERKEKKKRD